MQQRKKMGTESKKNRHGKWEKACTGIPKKCITLLGGGGGGGGEAKAKTKNSDISQHIYIQKALFQK